MRPGHAEIRIEQVSLTADTHFSWIGAHDDHGPFYYPHLQSGRADRIRPPAGIVYATTSPRATISTR